MDAKRRCPSGHRRFLPDGGHKRMPLWPELEPPHEGGARVARRPRQKTGAAALPIAPSGNATLQCRETESNCPPPPYEGAALPTELSRLGSVVHSPIQRSRHDLNVRPPDSKSGALIQLSYESNLKVGAGRIARPGLRQRAGERPASWAQARRAANLRYTPTGGGPVWARRATISHPRA